MSHDEATEFFEFNILGAWVGEGTPCFVKLLPIDMCIEEGANV